MAILALQANSSRSRTYHSNTTYVHNIHTSSEKRRIRLNSALKTDGVMMTTDWHNSAQLSPMAATRMSICPVEDHQVTNSQPSSQAATSKSSSIPSASSSDTYTYVAVSQPSSAFNYSANTPLVPSFNAQQFVPDSQPIMLSVAPTLPDKFPPTT